MEAAPRHRPADLTRGTVPSDPGWILDCWPSPTLAPESSRRDRRGPTVASMPRPSKANSASGSPWTPSRTPNVTQTCPVCRGRGVCPCPSVHSDRPPYLTVSGCRARFAESGIGDGEATLHDGETCHNCLGAGVRPVAVTPAHLRRAARRERHVLVSAFIEENGPVCAGFGRAVHVVEPSELTADHRVPVAAGGAPGGEENLTVLCRSCNSRKGRRMRTPPDPGPMTVRREHMCANGCGGDLYASEVVVSGAISRDMAERHLRARYGISGLFVEQAHPSDNNVAGRAVEIRDRSAVRVLGQDGRHQWPPSTVWTVVWRA